MRALPPRWDHVAAASPWFTDAVYPACEICQTRHIVGEWGDGGVLWQLTYRWKAGHTGPLVVGFHAESGHFASTMNEAYRCCRTHKGWVKGSGKW